MIASLMNFGGPDMLLVLFIIAIQLPCLGFWIWMIVDCATNEPPGNEKLVWMLVVLLAPFGSLIYLLARKLQRRGRIAS